MAITRTDSLQDWAEIISWMQTNLVPDFLQSVAIDQTDSTLLNCVGVGGQLLLQMKMGGTMNMQAAYLWFNNNANIAIEPSTTTETFRWAAKCKNGALMRFSTKFDSNTSTGSWVFYVLFTKNQVGKSAVVVSKPINGTPIVSMTDQIAIVAEGDNPAESRLTFSIRNMTQAQLIPFATNAAYNSVSYTPNAYYVQCGNFFEIPYTTFTDSNNVEYITNGCWVVKDE